MDLSTYTYVDKTYFKNWFKRKRISFKTDIYLFILIVVTQSIPTQSDRLHHKTGTAVSKRLIKQKMNVIKNAFTALALAQVEQILA